jgi:hypothetical protein
MELIELIDEIRTRLVVPLWPHAGKALGLSRGSTYAAAERGDIPTIRIGRLLRVPVRALERMLDSVGEPSETDETAPT